MTYGNYDGVIVTKVVEGKLRQRPARIQVTGYGKSWTVTVLDGIQEIDVFKVSGDKHAVKHEVKRRGWLG